MDIREAVQERYARIAEGFGQTEGGSSCCDSDCGCESGLYETDLSPLPQELAGQSLGCGDPIAIASLQPGQTVLDLGSGAGLDCSLAAERVGDSGRVIGVDMTPSMIERANRNKAKLGLNNVEYRLGHIEALPVESESVDVVISNCVINLSPDKAAVFREAFRVLRPGGRLAVSDMVTLGRFSPEQRADQDAWSACMTGAEEVADYVAAMKAAGFSQISIRDKAAPEVELADVVSLPLAAPRLFSARITAVRSQ